ncbi:MAG: hypothetical protein K2O73_01450 [Lachnospiraceae bacterium]|nr:hypothetical protein [Lachnospiraceae bacterium]
MEDTDDDKIFRAGDSELSRGELESLPCPFCTDNVSDETMQSIVETKIAQQETGYDFLATNILILTMIVTVEYGGKKWKL